MELNKDKCAGYNYIDEYGTVLSNSISEGKNDSLGGTARASLIYDKDKDVLIKGIKSYFLTTNGITSVTRHPSKGVAGYYLGNSRDHVVMAIAALKMHGEDKFVKNFINTKRKRPCPNMRYTIFQRLWFKALYSHTWSTLYLIIKLPAMITRLCTDNALRLIGGFTRGVKDPIEYMDRRIGYNRSWFQIFLSKNELILPTFASFYTIYEIMTLRSKKISSFLLKVHSLNFENSNYVARAMCGRKVSWPVYYVPSRKNRWSTRLDESNDRDIRGYIQDTASDNVELGLFEYYKSLELFGYYKLKS